MQAFLSVLITVFGLGYMFAVRYFRDRIGSAITASGFITLTFSVEPLFIQDLCMTFGILLALMALGIVDIVDIQETEEDQPNDTTKKS